LQQLLLGPLQLQLLWLATLLFGCCEALVRSSLLLQGQQAELLLLLLLLCLVRLWQALHCWMTCRKRSGVHAAVPTTAAGCAHWVSLQVQLAHNEVSFALLFVGVV
jgi:hypothetical protein